MDLVHDALTRFWDETVAEGFPSSIQAKLLSLASGFARNHVRQQRRSKCPHRLGSGRVASLVGGFASLTILTKNCFLEEIRKQYVTTARAKGAGEQRILYRHVFRNAMLLIVARRRSKKV